MGLLSKAVQAVAPLRWHPANWPRGADSLEGWLISGKNGETTYTGKSINEEIALTTTAIWSAVMQLSQLPASLPLHLYKRLDRGKDRATSHPLYNLLHTRPNSEMQAMNFREALMYQILLFGDCYAEKELDEVGNIKALWPLISRRVKKDRLLGELVFIVTLTSGQQRILHKDRILHITGFSPNGLIGLNPITYGRESIALTLALEEYGARFFGNNARPNAVLEHPEHLTDEARDALRESWNEMHQGLERSHRLAILEEGMKLHEFSISPESAQAMQSRKFQIEEVARIFNIPIHMLKNLDRATNNNIEFQGLEFVIYTLRPWLVRFEQAFSVQLLSEKEQKKYFFEHLIDGLLRGDTQTRHASYAVGRQWGYYSANDVREMENKNSIGEQGDIYLIPLNMVPADMAEDIAKQTNTPTEPPPKQSETPSENPKKSEEKSEKIEENKRFIEKRVANIAKGRERLIGINRKLFVEAAQTIINKESLAIRRALRKYLGQRGIPDLEGWINEFYKDLDSYVKKIMGPIIRSYAEQSFFLASSEINIEDPKMTVELERFIDEYLSDYSIRHVQKSLRSLMNLIIQENPEKLIEDKLDDWVENRPEMVANSETVRLSSAIASIVFFSQGLNVVWRAVGESCPFCLKLDGKKIRDGEFFVEDGGAVTPIPSDKDLEPMKIRGTRKHPPLHRGCDCIISPI